MRSLRFRQWPIRGRVRKTVTHSSHLGNVDPREHPCNAKRMGQNTRKPVKSTRAPRIRVPNKEKALFVVNTDNLIGVVQRLSLTGGSVVLSKGCLPHGTLAHMGLKTVFGTVKAQVQFMHAGAEGIPLAQAFRFLEMDSVSSRRYTAAVEQMQSAGFSDLEGRARPLIGVASKLRATIHRLSGI